MGDDQMVSGVDCGLDVVAHHARAMGLRRHRPCVGIGQRDLLVRCGQHLGLEGAQTLRRFPERGDLAGQALLLGRARDRWLLPVGRVQLLQIAFYLLLYLFQAPLHLASRDVAAPIVDRLEFGAVDRHAGFREQANLAAQRHELGTHLADRLAIILAEVGDGLERHAFAGVEGAAKNKEVSGVGTGRQEAEGPPDQAEPRRLINSSNPGHI